MKANTIINITIEFLSAVSVRKHSNGVLNYIFHILKRSPEKDRVNKLLFSGSVCQRRVDTCLTIPTVYQQNHTGDIKLGIVTYADDVHIALPSCCGL